MVNFRKADKSALDQPITAVGHDGAVTFDGWWIDIERTGRLAKISAKVNGYESKRIPLDRIEQVVWKRPSMLINGYLEFVVNGEPRPHGKTTGAAANPNAVLVTKQQASRFEPLHTALLDALAHARTNTSADPSRENPGR